MPMNLGPQKRSPSNFRRGFLEYGPNFRAISGRHGGTYNAHWRDYRWIRDDGTKLV